MKSLEFTLIYDTCIYNMTCTSYLGEFSKPVVNSKGSLLVSANSLVTMFR